MHQPLIWWDPNSAHQCLENKSAVGPYVHPPARCVHSGCPGAGRRKKCAASAIKWGIEHIRTWTPERFGGLLGTITQGFFHANGCKWPEWLQDWYANQLKIRLFVFVCACVSVVCVSLSRSLARHRTETCEWFVRHPAVWFCLPRTWLAQRIHHTMERAWFNQWNPDKETADDRAAGVACTQWSTCFSLKKRLMTYHIARKRIMPWGWIWDIQIAFCGARC